MGKKETLRQFLTYNKDINEVEEIFINLNEQLKRLHQSGYCVGELNSDTITLQDDNYSFPNQQKNFVFESIVKSHNKANDIRDNIVDLSKLAIGAYMSVEHGFCDYTALSTEYIKKNFNDISYFLPNSNYFSSVIIDDMCFYYSDYIQLESGNKRSNNYQKTKANNYGKMYAYEDDAAFIQIVFYPVILISIITVFAVLTKILN